MRSGAEPIRVGSASTTVSKEESPARHLLAGLFLVGFDDIVSAEQEGHTPKTCKADDCVNNAAEQSPLAAKEPGNQVKLENTDETPVKGTDNGQNQCYRIHNEPPM